MKKIKLLELKKSSRLSPKNFDLAVGELLNFSKEQLFLDIAKIELTERQVKQLNTIEERLISGTPLEYIFKKASFFGNDFYVDENVLIPRPETELLIEMADKFLKKNKKNSKILDLGTGSGCIAITLKKLNPHLTVLASDKSTKALRIAQNNAEKHQVQIDFVHSDLFEKVEEKFDLVLANLPYGDMNSEDYKKVKDPKISLDGGKNGTELIIRALKDLPNYLKLNGLAIFEINYDQESLLGMANHHGFQAEILKDLNNYDRFLVLKKN